MNWPSAPAVMPPNADFLQKKEKKIKNETSERGAVGRPSRCEVPERVGAVGVPLEDVLAQLFVGAEADARVDGVPVDGRRHAAPQPPETLLVDDAQRRAHHAPVIYLPQKKIWIAPKGCTGHLSSPTKCPVSNREHTMMEQRDTWTEMRSLELDFYQTRRWNTLQLVQIQLELRTSVLTPVKVCDVSHISPG